MFATRVKLPGFAWNPHVFGELEGLFDHFRHRSTPSPRYPVNAWTTDEATIVAVPVPGVAADRLEVTVEGSTLTIGVRPEAPAEPTEGRYLLRERRDLTAEVALQATHEIDTDRLDAQVRDGLLTVTLPRVVESSPRRIAVRVR